MSDVELAWLEDAYRAHKSMVFAACMQFAQGDRAWALDRMQDTYVLLARDHSSIEDKQKLEGWLYRAAVNQCLMALRRRRLWGKLETLWRSTLDVVGPTPDRLVRARRDLKVLEKGLAKLTNQQRAVFVLVELEHVSQKEVGELLKVSKGQVSKLHTQAVEALRKQEWEGDHG